MWINTITKDYPVTEADIRAQLENTSFANPFTPPAPFAWVAPTPAPAHDPITQGVREIAPELNGVWQQRWQVYQLSADQALASLDARNKAVMDSVILATQSRLDAFARTRGYDDIKSASDYAGCSVTKFSTEGTYCRDARAETWAKLYEMLAEVEAGTRPVPAGFQDVQVELPPLVWPQ